MEKKRFKVSNEALIIYFLLFIFVLLLILPADFFERPSTVGKITAVVRILGTSAPTFDHDISNFTINQTTPFFFDVNCSDADALDSITYYDNFTGFDINSSTGVINKTALGNSSIVFNQSLVGNHTVKITCGDTFDFTTSKVFQLNILDVNQPPVLSPIGPQVAVEGQTFTLDMEAFDVENDTLSFNAQTTLFSVNSETGLINFTPTLDQVGNYTINFTVFDGELYDSEIVSFRITRGPFCGDNTCGSDESCVTCSEDCGVCPTPPQPPQQEPEGGDGGGGGAVTPRQPLFRCDERWVCSDWGVCTIDGLQSRNCRDINNCGTENEKPLEARECVYQPTCNDGVQNGGETGVDCGGPCEPCFEPSCFDGIRNQNETGVDCGGPCEACEAEKLAKVPREEIPALIEIARQFPWLLVIMIAVLLTFTISGDQVYIRRIQREEFETYREMIRKYRPWRRKIYEFVINTAVITLIASLYIYYFSNDYEKLVQLSFIPILLIIITPFVVSIVLQHYTYKEYLRRKKEERFNQTHKRELLQLIKFENEMLLDMESKLRKRIYSMVVSKKFVDFPELYRKVYSIYQDLAGLRKKRHERMKMMGIKNEILDLILAMLESKTLRKAAKDYPEFESIKRLLGEIEDKKDEDTTHKEEDLMGEIEQISLPYMRTLILSDEKLIVLYNNLVTIYEYYSSKKKMVNDKDSEITSTERNFSDKLKELSKKADVMKDVEQDNDLVKMYNGMVGLFNHYMKKHELSRSLDDL